MSRPRCWTACVWSVVLIVCVCLLPAARAGVESVPLAAPRVGPILPIWADSRYDESPAVVYNSRHDEYLVVWVERQGPATHDIWARRVAADGTLLSWYNVYSVPGGKLGDPAVAYNPDRDEYLVVYTHEATWGDHDIWAKRLPWNEPGSYVPYPVDVSGSMQWEPVVVYNPAQREYLIAFSTQAAINSNLIRVVRRSPTDAFLGDKLVGNVGPYVFRDSPALAHNADQNNYLLAYAHYWHAGSVNHHSIVARLLSADLGGASPELPVASDTALPKSYTSVAHAPGGDYLVSWTAGFDEARVYARRLGADGAPRGAAGGFIITDCAGGGVIRCHLNRVAFAPGMGFVVVWAYFDTSTPDVGNVYGRRVLPGDDQPAGPAFDIDAGPNYQGAPDVACAGGSARAACLVVEQHCSTPGMCSNMDIRGRLVYPWMSYLPAVIKQR